MQKDSPCDILQVKALDISEFTRRIIMITEWIDGFEIRTAVNNNTIVISANREGLLSLAKHLAALADGEPGDHVHYDEYNALEEGSAEIIIERVR